MGNNIVTLFFLVGFRNTHYVHFAGIFQQFHMDIYMYL